MKIFYSCVHQALRLFLFSPYFLTIAQDALLREVTK